MDTDTINDAASGHGHPVLDFVNTVADGDRMRDADTFATGAELVSILASGGLACAGDAPNAAQMQRLLQFREATYAVLSAIAAARAPRREDRLTIEAAMKSAFADATVTCGPGRPRWEPGPLGGLQDALALSLAEFLGSPELVRLRECRGCTHLFLDHGRGTGRKWCSMTRCGNRAKAQGFRQRQRAAG